MLVSWNWLKQYVSLDGTTPDEIAHRLMMAGLNHESTTPVAGTEDFCIDVEITSNRPDCLGHIGVAREASVLLERALTVPAPKPAEAATKTSDLIKVRIEAPDLCPRYTARVIQGVKIGPSPKWLVDRLAAIGQPSINNVVDVTNFVLMECGQPLHAFDLAHLKGKEIVVRRAKDKENFTAIDHKNYVLNDSLCVIADAERPVALAGVMGGENSEVTEATTDIVIESAQFAPLSIRSTSRSLRLASDSSYRFERGTDPAGVVWAANRACELILELAGGKLAAGIIDEGPRPAVPQPITLRLSRLPEVMGFDVPVEEARRILKALGCEEKSASKSEVVSVPPSWRRDLYREIDLVEEVARIHGYDKIPEDARVPMASSHRSASERVLAKVRDVMTGIGFDEAYTRSVVSQAWSEQFSPWSDKPALVATTPMLKGEDRVRKSIVPSLLGARRYNESVGNDRIELFETARVYLPQDSGLPVEHFMLCATTGQGFLHAKGVVETLIARICPKAELKVADFSHPTLAADTAVELTLGGRRLGYIGTLSDAGKKAAGVRKEATVLEIDLAVLGEGAVLIPKYEPISNFPTMSRDINLIVDEAILWADLAATVQEAGGDLVEKSQYKDTYRDAAKDGAGKKRLLFSLTIRSTERTLTGEEADTIRDRIIAACGTKHGAKLLS